MSDYSADLAFTLGLGVASDLGSHLFDLAPRALESKSLG